MNTPSFKDKVCFAVIASGIFLSGVLLMLLRNEPWMQALM